MTELYRLTSISIPHFSGRPQGTISPKASLKRRHRWRIRNCVTAAINSSTGAAMSNRTALLANVRLLHSVGIAAVISMAACTVRGGAVGLKGAAQSAGAVSATAAKDPAQPATDNLQPKLDHDGDALPTGAIVRLGTTRLRQKMGGSRTIAFSPDGRELVTVGDRGWIRF